MTVQLNILIKSIIFWHWFCSTKIKWKIYLRALPASLSFWSLKAPLPVNSEWKANAEKCIQQEHTFWKWAVCLIYQYQNACDRFPRWSLHDEVRQNLVTTPSSWRHAMTALLWCWCHLGSHWRAKTPYYMLQPGSDISHPETLDLSIYQNHLLAEEKFSSVQDIAEECLHLCQDQAGGALSTWLNCARLCSLQQNWIWMTFKGSLPTQVILWYMFVCI